MQNLYVAVSFLKVEICDKAKENQVKRTLNLQDAAENKKSPFGDFMLELSSERIYWIKHLKNPVEFGDNQ